MWIFWALLASVLWGLNYVFSGYLYERISIATTVAITSLAVGVFTLVYAYLTNDLSVDVAKMVASKKIVYFLIAATLAYLIATVAVALSIKQANATIAGFIEISYPLFIVLFSFLLFKETHLTLSTLVGGLLIFAASLTIYIFR